MGDEGGHWQDPVRGCGLSGGWVYLCGQLVGEDGGTKRARG